MLLRDQDYVGRIRLDRRRRWYWKEYRREKFSIENMAPRKEEINGSDVYRDTPVDVWKVKIICENHDWNNIRDKYGRWSVNVICTKKLKKRQKEQQGRATENC